MIEKFKQSQLSEHIVLEIKIDLINNLKNKTITLDYINNNIIKIIEQPHPEYQPLAEQQAVFLHN